jgi:hypothetical protein
MGKEKNFGDKQSSNGFKQNPQNINRNGQPRKIYTILKEQGYSGADVKTAFKELAFYNIKELKEAYANDELPIITKIVSGVLLSAYENQDYSKVKEIIEHIIGKAGQSIDITSGGEQVTEEVYIMGDGTRITFK